jgi:hypothetical protein
MNFVKPSQILPLNSKKSDQEYKKQRTSIASGFFPPKSHTKELESFAESDRVILRDNCKSFASYSLETLAAQLNIKGVEKDDIIELDKEKERTLERGADSPKAIDIPTHRSRESTYNESKFSRYRIREKSEAEATPIRNETSNTLMTDNGDNDFPRKRLTELKRMPKRITFAYDTSFNEDQRRRQPPLLYKESGISDYSRRESEKSGLSGFQLVTNIDRFKESILKGNTIGSGSFSKISTIKSASDQDNMASIESLKLN